MALSTPYSSHDYLKQRLLDLSFDESKIDRFLRASHLDAARDLLKSYVPTPREGRKGKYNHLCLYSSKRNQNWVVFDPCKTVPNVPNEQLHLFLAFAIYKPGNQRYIEYNTRSHSLRLRYTSKAFEGKYVNYTVDGPVLRSFDDEGSDSEANKRGPLRSAPKTSKNGSSEINKGSLNSTALLTSIIANERELLRPAPKTRSAPKARSVPKTSIIAIEREIFRSASKTSKGASSEINEEALSGAASFTPMTAGSDTGGMSLSSAPNGSGSESGERTTNYVVTNLAKDSESDLTDIETD